MSLLLLNSVVFVDYVRRCVDSFGFVPAINYYFAATWGCLVAAVTGETYVKLQIRDLAAACGAGTA